MKHFIKKVSTVALLASAGFLLNSTASALDVKLTDYLAYLEVDHEGEQVRIQRLSLIHISEPTRLRRKSRMPSSA